MEDKIKRLKEIVNELDKYDDGRILYESDYVDIEMLESEIKEIIRML